MILASVHSNIVNDHQMTVSCCADGEQNAGGGRAAPLKGETRGQQHLQLEPLLERHPLHQEQADGESQVHNGQCRGGLHAL